MGLRSKRDWFWEHRWMFSLKGFLLFIVPLMSLCESVLTSL